MRKLALSTAISIALLVLAAVAALADGIPSAW
jgi:hypothetical protein